MLLPSNRLHAGSPSSATSLRDPAVKRYVVDPAVGFLFRSSLLSALLSTNSPTIGDEVFQVTRWNTPAPANEYRTDLTGCQELVCLGSRELKQCRHLGRRVHLVVWGHGHHL